MKTFVLFLLSLGCFFFAGCSDSENPVNPTELQEPPDTTVIQQFDPTEHELTIDDFFHSIGDRWTYAVSLTITDTPPEYDTVEVKIVDSLAFDCGETDCSGTYQQIWQLSYLEHVDSMTVTYLHDSVFFDHPGGRISAHFPLIWHKSWVEILGPDPEHSIQVVSTVTDVSPITMWTGSVVLYWTIEGQYNYLLGVNKTVELTVAQGIGIVSVISCSETITWPSSIVTHYTWELINWNVD